MATEVLLGVACLELNPFVLKHHSGDNTKEILLTQNENAAYSKPEGVASCPRWPSQKPSPQASSHHHACRRSLNRA